MKNRDGKCEDRLNNIHCNYDYGDCCLPVVDTILCDDCICAEDGLVHRSRDCKLYTRVSKGGRDIPGQSLCPGTKIFPCLAVPLSRYKSRSKKPWTNPSVLEYPGTKEDQKTGKRCSKTVKGLYKIG